MYPWRVILVRELGNLIRSEVVIAPHGFGCLPVGLRERFRSPPAARPRALALCWPAEVRSKVKDRSNSASAPTIQKASLPPDAVVSMASASVRETSMSGRHEARRARILKTFGGSEPDQSRHLKITSDIQCDPAYSFWKTSKLRINSKTTEFSCERANTKLSGSMARVGSS